MLARKKSSDWKTTPSLKDKVNVRYTDQNPEELKDEESFDLLNVLTSVSLEELPPANSVKNKEILKRFDLPPPLFTDDPGDLIEDEAEKNKSDVSIDVSDECGQQSTVCEIRRLSPSLITPAPHWWERGPEVLTQIHPTPESKCSKATETELGFEFPFGLSKQVEVMVRDKWEEMQQEGLLGSVEESQSDFDSVVVDTQVNVMRVAMSYVKRRTQPGAPRGSVSALEDLKEASRQFFGKHHSDIEDTTSSSSESTQETINTSTNSKNLSNTVDSTSSSESSDEVSPADKHSFIKRHHSDSEVSDSSLGSSSAENLPISKNLSSSNKGTTHSKTRTISNKNKTTKKRASIGCVRKGKQKVSRKRRHKESDIGSEDTSDTSEDDEPRPSLKRKKRSSSRDDLYVPGKINKVLCSTERRRSTRLYQKSAQKDNNPIETKLNDEAQTSNSDNAVGCSDNVYSDSSSD